MTNSDNSLEHRTGFVSRMIYMGNRIRLYVHIAGLEDAFSGIKGYSASQQAMMHAVSVVMSNLGTFNAHFVIAGTWGEGKDKMLEFYGLLTPQETWPNVEARTTYFYRNHLYVPESEIRDTENRRAFSRDFDLVKGIEEQVRLGTTDLREYFEQRPDIPVVSGKLVDHQWIPLGFD